MQEGNACQVSWGAHVNTKWRYKAKDYPAWANRLQQKSWTKTGLIVWEAESQRIVRLSATQALSIQQNNRQRMVDQLPIATAYLLFGQRASSLLAGK